MCSFVMVSRCVHRDVCFLLIVLRHLIEKKISESKSLLVLAQLLVNLCHVLLCSTLKHLEKRDI